MAIACTSLPLLLHGPRVAWDHILRFPYEITHLDEWTDRFMAAYRTNMELHQDPELRAVIGSGTVDLMNFEQHIVFYNQLEYRPRPIPQSYSAYTPALLEANARHFRTALGPQFVVLRMNTIDGRYPGQEDTLALLEIARRYELVLEKPTYIVVKRRAGDRTIMQDIPTLLKERWVTFGQAVPLPEGQHPLWVEIEIQPTFLGRLRATLYHVSPPMLVAGFDDGREKRFRLLTATSGSGFIIRPLIENSADVAALITGSNWNSPAIIRIEHTQSYHRYFWKSPHIKIFSLDGDAKK